MEINVIIIDDSAFSRKIVMQGLESNFENIKIDEARDGRDAQAKLEKKHYDLILCDWEMPMMSGEELLCWVRQHPNLNAVPFIMLTSHHEKEQVLKAIRAGVTDYLVKPYTIVSLLQKITSHVDKFNQRQFRMRVYE